MFTCASYNSKFLWLGDQNGHIYSIDPQNGVVNRYEIPEIKQAISRLLVTESGLMYITTNDGAYEYNIGYKQLTKLPFTIPKRIVASYSMTNMINMVSGRQSRIDIL
ncbi:hypothetical protein BFINE_38260 [Bacteroides finegoldii DSM 17565]|nr:hypothetical protein BFINE_38260 [Bacteroides finegoldii DSM 17565]